jgi:hypothetical protein
MLIPKAKNRESDLGQKDDISLKGCLDVQGDLPVMIRCHSQNGACESSFGSSLISEYGKVNCSEQGKILINSCPASEAAYDVEILLDTNSINQNQICGQVDPAKFAVDYNTCCSWDPVMIRAFMDDKTQEGNSSANVKSHSLPAVVDRIRRDW